MARVQIVVVAALVMVFFVVGSVSADAPAPSQSDDIALAAGLSPSQSVPAGDTDDVESMMGPSASAGVEGGDSASGPSSHSGSPALNAVSAVCSGVVAAVVGYFLF